MINIEHKNDLITLDFRLNQIRYCEDIKEQGFIHFVEMGRDSSNAYEYLFKEDKESFFESLKEDILNFTGKEIQIQNLKIIEV